MRDEEENEKESNEKEKVIKHESGELLTGVYKIALEGIKRLSAISILQMFLCCLS